MTRSSPLCEETWTAWRRSSTSSRRITMRWDPCWGQGHIRHDQWVCTHQDNHFTSCQGVALFKFRMSLESGGFAQQHESQFSWLLKVFYISKTRKKQVDIHKCCSSLCVTVLSVWNMIMLSVRTHPFFFVAMVLQNIKTTPMTGVFEPIQPQGLFRQRGVVSRM